MKPSTRKRLREDQVRAAGSLPPLPSIRMIDDVDELRGHIIEFMDLFDFVSFSFVTRRQSIVYVTREGVEEEGTARKHCYRINPPHPLLSHLRGSDHLVDLVLLLRTGGLRGRKFSHCILKSLKSGLRGALRHHRTANAAFWIRWLVGDALFFSMFKRVVLNRVFHMKNVDEAIRLTRCVGFLELWSPTSSPPQRRGERGGSDGKSRRGRGLLSPFSIFPIQGGTETPLSPTNEKMETVSDIFGVKHLHHVAFSANSEEAIGLMSSSDRETLLAESLSRRLWKLATHIIGKYGLTRKSFMECEDPVSLNFLVSLFKNGTGEEKDKFVDQMKSFSGSTTTLSHVMNLMCRSTTLRTPLILVMVTGGETDWIPSTVWWGKPV